MGSNVRSFSLLKNPRRMLTYASESLFLYQAMTGRGIRDKSALDFAKQPVDVKLCHGFADWNASGSSYAVDMINLAILCQISQARTIFEIGTSTGQSTHILALNAPQADVFTMDIFKSVKPKLLTTLVDDEHIQTVPQFCFDGTPEAARIRQVIADSACFDFSPFHGKIDLFFIDGAHSYEYVRSDTLNALRCCHQGSILAWHDFGERA
jgi:predicted O-methyltransferase YrrM